MTAEAAKASTHAICSCCSVRHVEQAPLAGKAEHGISGSIPSDQNRPCVRQSVLVLILLGELTSPLQNLWYFARYLKDRSQVRWQSSLRALGGASEAGWLACWLFAMGSVCAWHCTWCMQCSACGAQ